MTEHRPLTLDDGEDGLARVGELLKLEPDSKPLHEAKHWLLLSLGRLAEGWPEYKWHLDDKSQVSYDTFPVPRWDGSALTGKHVLVWLEHGIGDQIFAAGMFPDLIKIAASVTIMCSRRLVPLFRRSFPKAITYKVGEPVPVRLHNWAFDCQLSYADVGAAVRPSIEFKQPAYLQADPVKTFKFRSKYRKEGALNVGLSWWSKNNIHTGKSMALHDMRSILLCENCQFVNLQYGDCSAEIEYMRTERGAQIIDDRSFSQFTDMDTFAAQVAAMDFVVTTSNTTAHVAGALGVPGIVLLPRNSTGRFWYWHNERKDSPWYPSLQLLRKPSYGQWDWLAADAASTLWDIASCHARKLRA